MEQIAPVMEQIPPIVQSLTQAGWLAFAIIFVSWFRKPLIELLPNLTKLNAFGLELEIAKKVSTIAAQRGSAPDLQQSLTVARRLSFFSTFLKTLRILWVDDNPDGNSEEVKFLEGFGIKIKQVTSTEAAKAEIGAAKEPYQIIISDMVRGNDTDAGKELAAWTANQNISSYFLIYRLHADFRINDTPKGAFGMTNEPAELYNLIADVAARVYRP
jgi:CheY-like chemotaxis protein